MNQENKISRRDLFSVRLNRQQVDQSLPVALRSDFTAEMLFMEMIKLGKDPASMSRDDMLRVIYDELNNK
jgi:hypothetical protein